MCTRCGSKPKQPNTLTTVTHRPGTMAPKPATVGTSRGVADAIANLRYVPTGKK